MSFPVLPHGFLGAQGDSDTYSIERSLRFNSADSAYLNRTPASAGNRKTWTWSGWIKRTRLGTTQRFFTVRSGNDDTTTGEIAFETTNQLIVIGWSAVWRRSSMVFRDPSAWYHVIVAMDTTQATANNRVRIYLNGSELTSYETTNNPSQNADLAINQNLTHYLGTASYGNYSDFYLAEVNFIDGQALTPSSFGETDAITGRWKAKAYSGTYGTNGFYLKFADNSGTTATTLGRDSSSNGNNWTPNNFVVSPVASAGNDSLVDSPTNYGTDTGLGGEVRGNYCTLNPLSNNGGTMVDGNIDFYGPSAWRFAGGTIAVSSGKWYIEATHFGASVGNTEGNVYSFIGFIKPSTVVAAGSSHISHTSSVIGIGDSGWAYNFASGSSVTTGFGSGDVASVSIDFTTGSYNIRKNNTSVASGTMAFTGELIPAVFSYASSNRWQPNFGQRPFAYTAPSGFKALCTQNLTQPTIQKPSTAMDVVTYTGNGATSQDITGLSFSPDLVWLKSRTDAYDHRLKDTIRGNFALFSNLTNAESGYSLDFLSNGIRPTLAYNDNINSKQYVAWSWDAGSTNSTNTSGSITSTVRVNPQAGFSIVSYTGTGANATVGHGLGVAPKMIIARNRNSSVAQNWQVYHSNLTSASFRLRLNTTDAQDSVSGIWNSTNPTSSVFSIGTETGVNESGKIFIAYCFSEIEGYSKFGSYTGNGSSDGPFVWCGFRPRWVIIKNSTANSSSGYGSWKIIDASRDTYNGGNPLSLYANANYAEGKRGDGSSDTFTERIDFLSNGFKLGSASSYDIETNESGVTYIFAAFAESPFKYARAR